MKKLLFISVLITGSVLASVLLAQQNPKVQTAAKADPKEAILRKCMGLGHFSMMMCVEEEAKREFLNEAQTKPAAEIVVPAKNPIPADDLSIAKGEKIYERYCLSCHGIEGKGDGNMSAYFAKAAADLSRSDLDKKDDVYIFKKITAGNYPMPGFEQHLSEEDLWHAVNYLRTLSALQDENK